MNKSVEAWQNLERAVTSLEKMAGTKPSGDTQKNEAVEHIDKLISKLEDWCKLYK